MASPSLAMTCVISCAQASEGASRIRILEVRAKCLSFFGTLAAWTATGTLEACARPQSTQHRKSTEAV